jgi:hypothetical protein
MLTSKLKQSPSPSLLYLYCESEIGDSAIEVQKTGENRLLRFGRDRKSPANRNNLTRALGSAKQA